MYRTLFSYSLESILWTPTLTKVETEQYRTVSSHKQSGESEYVKLLYVLAEHRLQNTESHVYKITNVPVSYMVLGLNDFDAGKSIAHSIGRGGPCNECCPHQNHYVPHRINNRYIKSYNAT